MAKDNFVEVIFCWKSDSLPVESAAVWQEAIVAILSFVFFVFFPCIDHVREHAQQQHVSGSSG